MTVKLSIITPVYNVAAFLPQTVQSVLEQTEKDFELILVDDGATDGSGALCDAFALADSRVKVIHQKNAGVSAARNAGLEAARGDYIGWVDSDDIIEKDMFARMLSLAEKHGAEVVQCCHDRADGLNNAVRGGGVTAMTGEDFVRRMFTKRGGEYTNQVALWSKIYRRSLWQDIRFPVGMVYEDEMQTYKVCLKAKKIVETEDILYHYIKRENSIITGENESAKKLLDKQLALQDRLEYLPEKVTALDKTCAETFMGYSKQMLCKLYRRKETEAWKQGVQVLLANRSRLLPYANRYDALYLRLLSLCPGWILKNEFQPIQIFLGKIKALLGKS